MYALYLYGLVLLHTFGLKKTAVRVARYLHERSSYPLKDSELSAACWEFMHNRQSSFPSCLGNTGCGFPILSEGDSFHQYCREAQVEEDARIEADWKAYELSLRAEDDARHLTELMDSFCTETGCYEEADSYTGKCTRHDPSCQYCGNDPCVCKDDIDDDNNVSTNEVYSRAYDHFGGNAELAREAAGQYPGDFM